MAEITEGVEKLAIQGKVLYDVYTATTDAFTQLNQKIVSSADSANRLRIQFQQSFGMFTAEEGRSLVKRFSDVSAELISQGVTVEKLAEAYKAVGRGINSFIINRSDQAVESFSKLAAINSKFGVDMQNTVGVINYLSTGFNKSTEDITKFSNKLMQFSRETGQEFRKVFQDFNQSIQSFYTILDPDKAATQFMSFQQMARGFGSTVSELMGVAAKFDDIEQGVQFGAQLNNVLSAVGGSFDAMFASTASYDERIKLVVQSIANSRDQINAMSEVSQRAYVRQLQQTTGLSGQMIQAVLANKDLAASMDDLTKKQFEQVEAKPIDQMADNFTTFQERSELFMNQYMRVGARLEAFFDQSTKNVRDTQNKILKPIADTLSSAKDAKDLLEKIKNSFSATSLTKIGDDIKKEFDRQVKEMEKSIAQSFAQPKSVLGYSAKPPGRAEPPAGGGQSVPVYNPNTMTEAVQKGATAGIQGAATTALENIAKAAIAKHEIVVHVKPTDVMIALLRGESGPIVLNAARGK